MCLGAFSSSFMLPWVHWFSCTYRLLFGSKWNFFQSTFLQIFFSLHFPSSLFGTLITCMLYCLILSYWPLRIYSYFSVIFPSIFSLDNFCWLAFRFTDPSSLLWNLLLTCNECLISDIVSFQFYIFHLFLLYSSIALLKFSTFTNFTHIFLYFL